MATLIDAKGNRIELTSEEFYSAIESAVCSTLANLDLKASGMRNSRIYRQDMIKILGSRRRYEVAVNSGLLPIQKSGNRTSKVWTRRSDFERFLKLHCRERIPM